LSIAKPVEFYQRFATDLFKLDTKVNFFGSIDTYKVSYAKKGNTVTNEEFSVSPKESPKVTGRGLLEYALLNTNPHFTYEVDMGDKTVRVPDTEAIQTAHRKIDNIRARYLLWLIELPNEDKQLLEKLYNDTYNCYRLREYDGSHLTFPGLDLPALKIPALFSSQRDAAWRIIQNNGGLTLRWLGNISGGHQRSHYRKASNQQLPISAISWQISMGYGSAPYSTQATRRRCSRSNRAVGTV